MDAIIGILSRLFSGAGIIIVILLGLVINILEPVFSVLIYVLKYALYGIGGFIAAYFVFGLIITFYDMFANFFHRKYNQLTGKPKPKKQDTLRTWRRKWNKYKKEQQAKKKTA